MIIIYWGTFKSEKQYIKDQMCHLTNDIESAMMFKTKDDAKKFIDEYKYPYKEFINIGEENE